MSDRPGRLLHQFACTGGTLLCKVIAGLPDVHVLSEVHPRSALIGANATFAPSDVRLLAAAGKFPDLDNFSDELLGRSLQFADQWLHERQLHLIIRDHTHSDFCLDHVEPRSRLRSIGESIFPRVLSVMLVRHPADSFASLRVNGWVHFTPNDFETYCKRYTAALDALSPYHLLRYEDFVKNPKSSLRELCRFWCLQFDETALEQFHQFKFSGDSGRSGAVIGPRVAREESHAFRNSQGLYYDRLLQRLGYSRKNP